MPGQKRDDALRAFCPAMTDSKKNAPLGFKPEGAFFIE
jgi:hypothetical protein